MLYDDLIVSNRMWDPWRELVRLQDDVGRLFAGFGAAQRASFPQVNLSTNDEGAFIEAELPGVAPDAIDISVLGDTVTLSGSRATKLPAEARTHQRERFAGEFVRTVQLPFRADSEKAQATFQNGVLELFVPRAQADKPARITIKTS